MATSIPTTAQPLAVLAHPCSVRRALFRHIDRIEALAALAVALDLPTLDQLGARFERINPRCIAKICRLIYVFHRVGPSRPNIKKAAAPFGVAAAFAVSCRGRRPMLCRRQQCQQRWHVDQPAAVDLCRRQSAVADCLVDFRSTQARCSAGFVDGDGQSLGEGNFFGGVHRVLIVMLANGGGLI
jgi:hypothetical protein